MAVVITTVLWIVAGLMIFPSIGPLVYGPTITQRLYGAINVSGGAIVFALRIVVAQLGALDGIAKRLHKIEEYTFHLQRLDPALKEKLDAEREEKEHQ